MELCSAHWSNVQDALRLRGLWELQCHTQEEKNALIRWINGERRPGDPTSLFDSVIAVQTIIYQKALDVVGMAFFMEDGCPMCAMALATDIPAAPGEIINHAADQVLKAAIENGLIKVTMQ